MLIRFNYRLTKGQDNMDRKAYHHTEKQLSIELLLEKETFFVLCNYYYIRPKFSKYFLLLTLTLSRPIGSGCAVYMFLLPS